MNHIFRHDNRANPKVKGFDSFQKFYPVFFGAFVKFPVSNDESGQAEGLIHISELSEDRISHPSQVLRIEQLLNAKIVKIADGRVYLSLKNLKQSPIKETREETKEEIREEPKEETKEETKPEIQEA